MKKLVFSLVSILIIALSATTAFAIDGDGTEETPFIITDQGELELVTDFPDCHFKLANDIELEGTWIPLCKQTSSGYFEGVFDGNGYTISNLLTDGSVGGLFKSNSGTIKNLKITIAAEGTNAPGTVCGSNYGTILNCSVKGNISSEIYQYVGGICAYNYKNILQCDFVGNIETTYYDKSKWGYLGGICGNNCNSSTNKGTIEDCYFIGELKSKSDTYKGGITGANTVYVSNTSYYGTIKNCYAVPTFSSDGSKFGISYNITSGDCAKSFYDKTVSGLDYTSYGTPKSTAAMKMKKTYTDGGWDFDTVWGIDKNINDGYPYLLWEYPDVEEELPYSVNSIKIIDLAGNELSEIPNDNFYYEINVTKNDDSKNADCLIIAVYDEKGVCIDIKYMKGTYYQNQTIDFSTMLNNSDNKIGSIKGFVWDSVAGMTPLSNSL